ncbi:hypothetical protein BGZ82_008703 [Podila clonocystis]|nr:hypothetical protein BGZ82_008703 [Podila clonocystis]
MATIQTRFHDWLIKNKACISKLEFRDDNTGCGGVYATADIAADEVFLLIPCEPLVLTDALARQHLPKSTSSVDCRTALILYLIQQRLLRDRSFFQPYLDMVPEKIYTALEFDDEDLEHLRGTNAFLTVKELKKDLREKYEQMMELASDAETPEEEYTWEMFLWAETVVSSRAYPAHLFGECREGEVVLIPLADMLNHQSRHKISWLKTPQGLQMSGSAVKKGEQVFNNYGPKSNEELLVGYGFCIEDNADDMVTLKTNFSRDPDQDRKTAILKRVGVTDETIHYLGHGGRIPHPLLTTMRVMAMNPTEVERYYSWMEDEEQDIIHGERKEQGGACSPLKEELQFVNLRNELAMLDLMDLLLSSKLKIIRDWDDKLSEPLNAAQEYAQIYRQGQKQILSSCSEAIRGMFSSLLQATLSADLAVEQTAFVGAARGTGLSQRLQLAPSSYSIEHFRDIAAKETRTISELKLDAAARVLLTAERIMVEHKETSFGEAFLTAFPGHGWGEVKSEEQEERDEDEEMTVQMEQDAIVTCYLVYEQENLGALEAFVSAAKKFDYSSQLDEDMVQDVLDLRLSLQETLENVDPEEFDFEKKYTPEAFLWATGLIEALSLAFHIDGKVVAGVVAPRGASVV